MEAKASVKWTFHNGELVFIVYQDNKEMKPIDKIWKGGAAPFITLKPDLVFCYTRMRLRYVNWLFDIDGISKEYNLEKMIPISFLAPLSASNEEIEAKKQELWK